MIWLYGNVEIEDDPELPDSVPGLLYGQSTGAIMTGHVNRIQQFEISNNFIVPTPDFIECSHCGTMVKNGLAMCPECLHCMKCGKVKLSYHPAPDMCKCEKE